MATGTLVSVEEYLSTSYRPDCEYIDGVILERNLGGDDHSSLQGALTAFFFNRRKEWNIRVRPEQRVQVKATRFRVPDVCVILAREPRAPIVTKPPFICVEILSKEDTFDSVQDRIDDYLAMGVAYVWVINPRSRRVFVHTAEGISEVKDGILRTQNPELVVPLAEIFESLIDLY
jgi:Uma2 family endonuclease